MMSFMFFETSESVLIVYDEMPEGWRFLDCPSSPGYKWICNGKSRFSKEYEHALLREKG